MLHIDGMVWYSRTIRSPVADVVQDAIGNFVYARTDIDCCHA
jgi:hypothetical protein